jgi:hypothetical protein
MPNTPDCLEQLGKSYEKFKKYQNDLQYAIDNQNYFPGIDIGKINTKIDEIQEEISKIQSDAKKYLEDPYSCVIAKRNDILLDNIIPLQVTPSKLGNKWFWEMGGWFAVLKRKSEDTNVFEAEWRGINTFKSDMTIHESGNDVYIVRTDTSGPTSDPPHEQYNTVYKGTFNEDGTKANGVDLQKPKEPEVTWTAKIED